MKRWTYKLLLLPDRLWRACSQRPECRAI